MASISQPSLQFINHPHVTTTTTRQGSHSTSNRNWHLSITITLKNAEQPNPSPGADTSTTSDSPTSTKSPPPPIFHLFPRLPNELQDKIWTHALENHLPRNITIRYEPCEFQGYGTLISNLAGLIDKIFTPSQWGKKEVVDTTCFVIPPMLHTSGMARTVAKKAYKWRYCGVLNRKIWVRDEDCVIVPPEDRFRSGEFVS